MVFSTPLFLFLFLPMVLAGYFVLPNLRWRNQWLLLVSLFFYAWGEPAFIALLLASTLINYGLGRWMENAATPSARKSVVAMGVIVNVGFLAFFKYAALAVASLNAALRLPGLAPLPVPAIALPIGISFFTFHALSYIIDIYRGKWRAARDPRDVALYIFFFPQLVAGPILRWSAIGPQLEQRTASRALFADGIRRFAGGLAKKTIVANAVAVPADQIFALPPGQLSTSVAWFGALCYMIQIYFDFSGYSDMAVGLGKMFGFTFIENFQFPYIAQSVRDFWRRWHISLSSWFRDYVYIPLGGNRVSAARNHLNLVIVFFLCGLWHGASWTFVVWGLYHGLFLVLERTPWGGLLGRAPQPLRHIYTLLVVLFGWVLFRADTFAGATHYLAALAGVHPAAMPEPLSRYATNEVKCALTLGIAFSAPLLAGVKSCGNRLGQAIVAPAARAVYFGAAQVLEIVLVVGLLLVSSAWLAGGTYNPFIYFRF
jgi:alginate O-acetyltransferase complex protein AlgI